MRPVREKPVVWVTDEDLEMMAPNTQFTDDEFEDICGMMAEGFDEAYSHELQSAIDVILANRESS